MTNREFIIKTLPEDRLKELRELRILTMFVNKTIAYSKSYVEPRRAMKDVCISQHGITKIDMDIQLVQERAYNAYLKENETFFEKNVKELPRTLVITLARMNAYKPFIKAIKEMWESDCCDIFHIIDNAKKTTEVLDELRLTDKDTYWNKIWSNVKNLEMKYGLSWD